jgi:hypothetical protein
MNQEIKYDLERLTENAALRREDLLLSALKKSRWRKALNIAAGILSLTSAGAITLVLTNFFGSKGIELTAAIVALLSGMITLMITAYFTDEETFTMLSGSSKYLALRESVYHLVLDPVMSDEDRFKVFGSLQAEYARLDEAYSRYFPIRGHGTTAPDVSTRGKAAADRDVSELHRRIDGGQS